VLPVEAIERMRDGAVLANCGHFPWEIDVAGLRAASVARREIVEAIERIELPNGRHVILLAGGRMFNLAGREPKGNSLESMDLGFLLQTLSLERVATDAASLVAGAQPVPDDIDRTIARRMLAALNAAE
jgi:adenosylhomocysteinase